MNPLFRQQALAKVTNPDQLLTGTGHYDTRHAGSNKTVAYSDLSLTGSAARNYSLAPTASGSGSISQRPTVTWTGAAGDGKWSTAGNWADNALPDYDPASALDNVGRILLSSGSTPLRITDSQAVRLRHTALEVSGAGLDLDVTGGIFTGSGKLVASAGSLKLTAHSPIVIGSGGLEASQGISLLATTPEGTSTILIDGPLTSTSGPIVLSAYKDITLNADLTAATISRNSQTGSIQVAPNVAVSATAPVVSEAAPAAQVAQTVATSLATATSVASVPAATDTPAVEKSEPATSAAGSAVSVITSTGTGAPILLASLNQTVGGGEGQFGGAPAPATSTTSPTTSQTTASSSGSNEKPAATTEKTAQADAKLEAKSEAKSDAKAEEKREEKAESKKEEKKEEKKAKDEKDESGEKKPATKTAQKKVAQCS